MAAECGCPESLRAQTILVRLICRIARFDDIGSGQKHEHLIATAVRSIATHKFCHKTAVLIQESQLSNRAFAILEGNFLKTGDRISFTEHSTKLVRSMYSQSAFGSCERSSRIFIVRTGILKIAQGEASSSKMFSFARQR